MVETRQSLSRILRSGSFVVVALGVELVFSLLAKVLVSREFGTVGFGTISVGIVTLTTIQTLALLGTNKGVARFLPRYDSRGDRRGVILTGLSASLTSAVALAAVGVVSAEFVAVRVFHDPSLTPVIRLFALVSPCSVLFRYAVGTARGLEQTTPRVVVQNLVRPGSRILFVLVVLAGGLGLYAGAVAFAAPFVVAAVAGGWYLWRYTPLKDSAPANTKYRELLSFSLPLAVTSMMWFVFANVDTYLIGLCPCTTTGDVGVYRTAYTLALLLMTVNKAFSYLVMPVFSKYHAEERYDDIREMFRRVSLWVLTGSFPMFLFLAGTPRPTLGVTFGPDFTAGAAVLVVLSFGFATHFVTGPTIDSLTTIGRPRWVMYDTLVAAGVNVAANALLIPRYEILGAALATTASYAVLNVALLAQLYRVAGAQPFSRPMLTVVVLGSVEFFIYDRLLGETLTGDVFELAARAGLFAALYGLTVVPLVIDREAIEFIRG